MHWLIERHDELERKLAHQSHVLERLENRMVHMSAALDRITSAVADTKTVTAQVVTVITDLQAQIAASIPGTDDSDALNKLADDLAQAKADILAAIAGPAPVTPAPSDGTDTVQSTAEIGQNS